MLPKIKSISDACKVGDSSITCLKLAKNMTEIGLFAENIQNNCKSISDIGVNSVIAWLLAQSVI